MSFPVSYDGSVLPAEVPSRAGSREGHARGGRDGLGEGVCPWGLGSGNDPRTWMGSEVGVVSCLMMDTQVRWLLSIKLKCELAYRGIPVRVTYVNLHEHYF